MKRRLIKVAAISIGCILIITAVAFPVIIPNSGGLLPIQSVLCILAVVGMATLGVFLIAKGVEL
ncbi:unnamed protein product [marine sediment metagenome]|uniref:Uncharacterized protein n=1 Tax=marine sediment metagenome TaxID=412755 RepID=X1V2E0_9ZZZZ